jgi:hypothetical protein
MELLHRIDLCYLAIGVFLALIALVDEVLRGKLRTYPAALTGAALCLLVFIWPLPVAMDIWRSTRQTR